MFVRAASACGLLLLLAFQMPVALCSLDCTNERIFSPVRNDVLFSGSQFLLTWESSRVGPPINLTIAHPQYGSGWVMMADVGSYMLQVSMKPSATPYQMSFRFHDIELNDKLRLHYDNGANKGNDKNTTTARYSEVTRPFFVEKGLHIDTLLVNHYGMLLTWTYPSPLALESITINLFWRNGADTVFVRTLESSVQLYHQKFYWRLETREEAETMLVLATESDESKRPFIRLQSLNVPGLHADYELYDILRDPLVDLSSWHWFECERLDPLLAYCWLALICAVLLPVGVLSMGRKASQLHPADASRVQVFTTALFIPLDMRRRLYQQSALAFALHQCGILLMLLEIGGRSTLKNPAFLGHLYWVLMFNFAVVLLFLLSLTGQQKQPSRFFERTDFLYWLVVSLVHLCQLISFFFFSAVGQQDTFCPSPVLLLGVVVAIVQMVQSGLAIALAAYTIITRYSAEAWHPLSAINRDTMHNLGLANKTTNLAEKRKKAVEMKVIPSDGTEDSPATEVGQQTKHDGKRGEKNTAAAVKFDDKRNTYTPPIGLASNNL